MNNKVSIGSTTIVGWATALLALLPTIIKSIEEGQVAFNGPEKYLAIFGIASGLLTQVARYLQAHKLITVSNAQPTASENTVTYEAPHVIDEVPTEAPDVIPADGDNSTLGQP